MADDTIYRQAAIDAILHNQEVYSNNFGDDPIDKYTIAIIDNDAQTIAQLPSAQPEITAEQVYEYCVERGWVVLTMDEYHWLKSLKSKSEEWRWNGGGNY